MQVHVRTTQNVFINYKVASVGDRILAYLLDQIILIVFIIVMFAIYVNVKMDIVWVWIVTIVVPYLLYHPLFEIFMNGQSPGKRVFDIQVIRLDGVGFRVRGVSRVGKRMGAPAHVPRVRARRLLRFFAGQARHDALSRIRPPHNAERGARRNLALVLH